MKKGHRLRAPSNDGGLLAVTPLAEVAAHFTRTAARLAGWDHDFQGRRAGILRGLVHREVIAAACHFLRRHELDVPEIGPCSGDSVITPLVITGHQWWWEARYPQQGIVTANEIHIPTGRQVEVKLTSDDVIHDFYVPAFRVKKDAIPGRYTSIWFQATKIGTYHIFCAQYCGADHAEMIGWVYVMAPSDYAAWLSGGARNESMAQTGERLFNRLGCVTCHVADNTGRGPSLVGIYGKQEKLRNGDMKLVDEALIRQAIVNPNSIILPNYPPIIPSFQGQINEEQVLQLIAYIKSLGTEERKTNGK